jgi:hypothetical protein
MIDTLQLVFSDSVKILTIPIESSAKSAGTPIWSILIPAIAAIIVAFSTAFLTAFFTKRNEIRKIQNDFEKLNTNYSNDIKKLYLSIENENFSKRYEKKLEALKFLNNNLFQLCHITFDPEFQPDIEDYYNRIAMRANSFKDALNSLILEYSYLFDEEINKLMREVFYEAEDAASKLSLERDDYTNEGKAINEKSHELLRKLRDDMMMNSKYLAGIHKPQN